MTVKKYIIGAGLVATVLGGVASMALAEDTTQKTASNGSPEKQPMIIEIGPAGKALLRGTVKAVGANSLTVKSWGGDWIINIFPNTNVMPKNDFRVGDFVGVQGSVNRNAAWTIDAKIVRNRTERKEAQTNKKDIKEMVKQEKEMVKQEKPKNWEGTASNVNVGAKTLTLTAGGVAYSITLTDGVKIVDKKFVTTDFLNIKNGDNIHVWGLLSGTTIPAIAIRNLSIGGE